VNALIAGKALDLFMRLGRLGRRLSLLVGFSAVSVVLVIFGFMFFPPCNVRPTDTKIVEILYENKESLFSVDGVVGAGIARDDNNYIIGIAVYVEDDMVDLERIPSELNGFQVFVKRMSEASESERASMIIRK